MTGPREVELLCCGEIFAVLRHTLTRFKCHPATPKEPHNSETDDSGWGKLGLLLACATQNKAVTVPCPNQSLVVYRDPGAKAKNRICIHDME